MKLKSHSGAKKRVLKKGKKKFFMQKSGKRHLLSNKSKRQKNLHPRGMQGHKTNERMIERLLPTA